MTSLNELPPSLYNQIPETKEDLDWADLVTIDLSLFGTPEGKKQLAHDLENAIKDHGFFYLKNFGLSQKEVDDQFAIAQAVFALDVKEKEKYLADLSSGDYNKFRLPGNRIVNNGIRDNIETYNIARFNSFFDEHHKSHPKVILDNRNVIEKFAKYLQQEVIQKLIVLFGIILELEDEEQLAKLHQYEDLSEEHFRYMKYYKRGEEENNNLDNIWSHGHTDLGTLTLLFRQPVAALQIQNKYGEWKWVKPQPNSITVNICDTLSFLTAGYLPSTKHRVHAPPKDQQQYDRIGLLYFARPRNDIKLQTIDSPKLKRLGYTKNFFEEKGEGIPNVGEWVVAKQKYFNVRKENHNDPQPIIRGYTEVVIN
ncbi:hypothetical protein PACTADRAFT_76553 [Pachysolen tannophilus NRRL Y-2460]|uniref:Fe2OG dioxygenase domain-containing protein n=1 Tax=Pachysolen tannophilus NRRL Y-2460 TaxID=669874 RepID=A0A1E4TT96_PACTA|nr:hypothetical protein PACTADRAFT_76553 [Pachysolen tannophilus NRRL Y-2460]